jgi:hypothetical protein
MAELEDRTLFHSDYDLIPMSFVENGHQHGGKVSRNSLLLGPP